MRLPIAENTAHVLLVEPERGHVREGVEAQVAQPFGDQEQHDRPSREKTDGIEHAIESGRVHQGGDAEEGGGGEKVACDGEAVLQRRDAAAGRVEIGGGLGLVRRTPRDEKARCNEQQEHRQGDAVGSGGMRRRRRKVVGAGRA
jgi:hypothetical protein